MTFLNPLILIGLVAAAIPILLHLFNLRKLRTIEFSTLTFIKELQRTKIRRLKLRQLLLLILRTLIVLTLVLAFARPTLRGSLAGGIGSHAKTTAIVIVDDSFSMTVNDEHGELFKQAKRAATGIVDLLKEGDDVVLVKLSDIGRAAVDIRHYPTRDYVLLKKEIEGTRPSYVYRSIDDALRYASKLLAGTKNFNKEVYVVSDFQSGAFDVRAAASSQEKLFQPEVHCFLVPVGKRSAQNLGIENVAISTAIFEQNKPFIVRARIGNHSKDNVRDYVVSVFLNGTRVAQRGIDLPGETSSEIEFSVVPNSTGYAEGFVELENDDFEADDRRFFVVSIPERIRVLLVGKTSDFHYIRLALATRLSAGGSAFELQEISARQVSSAQIEQSDVVVLAGSQDLSSSQVNQFLSFLKNGGGLILFPEPAIQLSSFNSTVAKPLGLPPINDIDRGSASSGNVAGESFVEFEKVDLRHPVFEGMFEERETTMLRQSSRFSASLQRVVESPRVRISVRFAPTPRSNSIITLSNGSTFLAEQLVGSGRVLLFGVAPNLGWSDFPLKGLFVPLLHRAVSYLNRHHAQPDESLAGDDILLKSTVRTTVPWTVRDPANIDRTSTPSSSGWQQSLRFSNSDLIGVYSVAARDFLLQKFAVNLDPRESKLAKASTDEIETTVRRVGIDPAAVRYVEQPQDLERVVLQSRFGLELWKHFLAAALLLALTEMIVARSGKKEALTTS